MELPGGLAEYFLSHLHSPLSSKDTGAKGTEPLPLQLHITGQCEHHPGKWVCGLSEPMKSSKLIALSNLQVSDSHMW